MSTSGEQRARTVFPRLKAPLFTKPGGFRQRFWPNDRKSPRGVRIYSDEALTLGERFKIEIILSDRSLSYRVRVAWVTPLPQGAPAAYDVGLELLDQLEDEHLLEQVLEVED